MNNKSNVKQKAEAAKVVVGNATKSTRPISSQKTKENISINGKTPSQSTRPISPQKVSEVTTNSNTSKSNSSKNLVGPQKVQDKAIEFIKNGNFEALAPMLQESHPDFKFLNRLHSKYGKSSLMISIEEGRKEFVEMLLAAGAKLEIFSKHGMSAIHFAAYNDEIEIVDILCKKGTNLMLLTEDKNDTALHLACKKGYLKMVEKLIELGMIAVLDQQNKQLETALAVAIKFEYYELANLLLSKGADINITQLNGDSSLIKASFSGNENIVKFILQNNGSIHNRNFNNENALMTASKYGYTNILLILLQHGASVDEIDNFGRTSLIIACMGNKIDVLEMLITHHANVNIVDKWGYSALIYACTSRNSKCRQKMVEILVNNNADLNCMDLSYKTAIIHACKNNYFELVYYLIRYGADYTIKDIDDKLPIDFIENEEEKTKILKFCEYYPISNSDEDEQIKNNNEDDYNQKQTTKEVTLEESKRAIIARGLISSLDSRV
eukprot:gene13457-18050_t